MFFTELNEPSAPVVFLHCGAATFTQMIRAVAVNQATHLNFP